MITYTSTRIGLERRGFTLVELLVVLVIVAMLSALSLAGLAGVRDRSKAEKTRSTIRKLHEIVVPQYEDYLTRRTWISGTFSPGLAWVSGSWNSSAPVALPASGTKWPAVNRLWGTRLLMTLELPDQWSDVAPATTLPKWAVTAPVKRFASFKSLLQTRNPPLSDRYQASECLAMIVTKGGFSPDSIEGFRSDEIGDIDDDGAPEFLDGWGRPISFVRWPAGLSSAMQKRDVAVNPDPFDPLLVTGSVAFSPDASPPNGPATDYGVIPLIFSPGPDESLKDPSSSGNAYYGSVVGTSDVMPASSWVARLASAPSYPVPSNRFGLSAPLTEVPGSSKVLPDESDRDNITNHELGRR